jgi:hypothetical protein
MRVVVMNQLLFVCCGLYGEFCMNQPFVVVAVL